MIDAETRHAFESIYREDRWTNGSGPGSAPSSTIEYRGFVERFMVENKVNTVTDLGCGDWQFSKLIDWSSIDYTGLDIVESVIDTNNQRYGAANITFERLSDIADLPGGDLLLSKEVLQHLPNDTVNEYLREIASKYKYALITNAIEPVAEANRDIRPGDWRPLRLDQAPFTARGATVFVYFPQAGSHFWRNGVFLMVNDG